MNDWVISFAAAQVQRERDAAEKLKNVASPSSPSPLTPKRVRSSKHSKRLLRPKALSFTPQAPQPDWTALPNFTLERVVEIVCAQKKNNSVRSLQNQWLTMALVCKEWRAVAHKYPWHVKLSGHTEPTRLLQKLQTAERFNVVNLVFTQACESYLGLSHLRRLTGVTRLDVRTRPSALEWCQLLQWDKLRVLRIQLLGPLRQPPSPPASPARANALPGPPGQANPPGHAMVLHGHPGHAMAHHGHHGHAGHAMVPHGPPGHAMAPHGHAGHAMAHHGPPGHAMAHHGPPGHAMAPHGHAGHAMAPHGHAGHVMAHHGPPGHAMAPHWPPGHAMAHHALPGQVMAPHGPPGHAMAPPGPPGHAIAPHGAPGHAMAPHGPPGQADPPMGPPGQAILPPPVPDQEEPDAMEVAYETSALMKIGDSLAALPLLADLELNSATLASAPYALDCLSRLSGLTALTALRSNLFDGPAALAGFEAARARQRRNHPSTPAG